MLMIDLASSTTKVLFKASSSSGHTSLKLYRISPDGKWILYVEPSDNTYYVIRMHSIAEGKSYTISSNMYNSFQPIFSDDSKYVFFISSRNFSPSISSVEWNVSYSNDHYIFAIPLSKDGRR